MNSENREKNGLNAFGRIIGIFSSPKETFVSIDQKPTWLVPFLVTVIIAIGLNFLVMNIGIQDQIAKMEAMGAPSDRIEAVETQMQGPMRYIQIVAIPIVTLIIWAILSGILLFGSTTILGGEAKFKKVFSVVAWSSLVSLLGGIIKTLLILSKGTIHGVSTSLAVLLPTPGLADNPSVFYRVLSKIDIFIVWQLLLWMVGLAVINRFTPKKAATFVIPLWIFWIVVSVAVGSALGPRFGQ
jgi:hypothetical protein